MKKTANHAHNLKMYAILGVATVILVLILNFALSKPTSTQSRAAEPDYVLKTTVLSPAWGTVYKWKDKATVNVGVEHTYPISKMVFNMSTGSNSSKNVCTLTAEPFNCTFTVPYTGAGSQVPKGENSGFGMTIYTYDTAGHVYVEALQMWSHK